MLLKYSFKYSEIILNRRFVVRYSNTTQTAEKHDIPSV